MVEGFCLEALFWQETWFSGEPVAESLILVPPAGCVPAVQPLEIHSPSLCFLEYN